jgi:Ca-activated chloride channel family protein
MRFLDPHAALWLLSLPVLWGFCLLHRRLRERSRRLSGFGPGVERVSRIAGERHDLAIVALVTIAGAALVVAAMRPQMVIWTRSYESRDLLLLLDRSASMHAEDVQPSRARRASTEIRNFIRTKPDTIARVGLIGFAGSSVTLSQETHDPNVVLFYLDWIDEDPTPLFGTNLRAALENALQMIRKASPPRQTFVVIVSDGDDHGTDLQETVAKFASLRIPIYSIGIGSTEEVSIPALTDSAGRFLLDGAGQPLRTHLDEETLQLIARVTGGRYFRSTSGEELKAALDDISARERRFVGWTSDRYSDLYPWCLACGAIALATLLAIL